MKILIVDDNIENLEVMSIILRARKYNTISAMNGKEALEKLRREDFDLIITDILMPVMDGFMFCKECKLDKELSKIPLIFYTATYIDSKDRDFALSLGAEEFITKPQEPSVFLSIVENVIKKIEEAPAKVKTIKEENENEIMKLYSERLISKLEKKNIDLEKEIASHKLTLEKLEISKQRAEESDRLKTAFLQNISHEIRTPLNGIIGFSDLLVNGSLSSEDINEYSKLISNAGRNLLEIVNNVLDISKIETGQIKINKKLFPLNSMLNDLFVFFSQQKTNPEISFSYSTGLKNSDAIIISDEVKLNQIFTNLINNAVKFTERGSIVFGYTIIGKEIQFFVKDTGIGISDENKCKVFERFAQIENNRDKILSGAGLGLPICKGLVEKLGGRIWFKSQLNKGTSFYFTIPLETIDIDMSFDEELKEVIDKDRKQKILIGEDDFTCFMLLKKLLVNEGFSVLQAENGLQAVEAVKNYPDIDLVLLDIRMPLLDGIGATKKIKELRPNLPIIAQTAYAFSQEKDIIIASGCNDCITKPIEKNQLLRLIKLYTQDN